MPRAADRGHGVVHAWFAMRPRRWYADEVAPPGRPNVKLTARLWRYRSLVCRKQYYTDTYYRLAAARFRKKKRIRRS
jgi:hypothetical protein